MSPIWSEPFTVHTYEVDVGGRASVQSLCGFLQEAAGRNAESLGVTVPQLMEHGLTWMLSRLLVRIHEYPRWWEKLVIETWPSGFHRLFALREWRIFRRDELLGEATSAWLMVRLDDRRPIRPDSHGDWARRIHPERAIPLTLGKLPELQGLGTEGGSLGPATAHSADFTVRYRDLDMNGHANTISYLDWLLEVLPLDFRQRHVAREIEVNFLAELVGGEEIESEAALDHGAGDRGVEPPHTATVGIGVEHVLRRKRDSLSVARARTRWVPSG